LVDGDDGRGDTDTEARNRAADDEHGDAIRGALDSADVLGEKSGWAEEKTYIEPTTHMIHAIWIAVRRENLSAMKDDARAPTKEPKGIAAVIAPWTEDTLAFNEHMANVQTRHAYGLP